MAPPLNDPLMLRLAHFTPLEATFAQRESLCHDLADVLLATRAAGRPLAPEQLASAFSCLSRFPQHGVTEARVQAIAEVGRSYSSIDLFFDALPPLNEAARLTAELKVRTEIGPKVAMDLAFAQSESGNQPAALLSLLPSLRSAHVNGAYADEARLLNSIGGIFLRIDLPYRAWLCFQRSAQLCEPHANLAQLRVTAEVGLVCADIAKDFFARARDGAERAAANAARYLPDSFVAVQAAGMLARILSRMGQCDKGLAIARDAQATAGRSRFIGAELIAALNVGLVECEVRPTIGMARILDVVGAARNSPKWVRPILRVAIEATHRLGHTAQTQDLIEEFVELQCAAVEAGVLRHQQLHLIHRRDFLQSMKTPNSAPLTEREQWVQQLHSATLETSYLVQKMVLAEAVDDETLRHPLRVGRLAGAFAATLDCNEAFTLQLAQAATLHDLGKLFVPAFVRKCGSSPSWVAQKQTQAALRFLSQAPMSMSSLLEKVIAQQDENWDGSGPQALSGAQLSLDTRITSLVDAFDQLTHGPCVFPAKRFEHALMQLGTMGGKRLDPDLVASFSKFIQSTLVSFPDLDALADGSAVVDALNEIERMQLGLTPVDLFTLNSDLLELRR